MLNAGRCVCESLERRETHVLFIHSFFDGHLDCFPFLAIMSNAAMNIHGQVFRGPCVFISLSYRRRSGNTGSNQLCLTF